METEDATASVTFPELNNILTSMKDPNKAKRKKGLSNLQNMINTSGSEPNTDDLRGIFDYSANSLFSCLSDSSEMNRIIASNILLEFLDKSIFSEERLLGILPILHHRLATVPCPEESEDVKLLYINILKNLINIFQMKLFPFMNDIINILKETVTDKCPEVRIAACECASLYAKVTKEKFHLQSGSLVKPLLKGLTHQRFKNRIACIRALGDVLLYGNNTSIQDISSPLAQGMMDIPQVRLVVVTVGGELCMEMPDRYSYWQRILPLVLAGLRDDDKDVKEKAESLWNEAGKKYEMENEDQLKQEIDFDIPPEHYPKGELRHCVGCRKLVQQGMYHLLPGILTDLDDWQVGPRLQAAKLLTTLVLIAESGTTQYAEKVLCGLVLASSDKEQNVVKQVVVCSEYLGHFLPPATYLPLILPRVSSEGQYGEQPLIILAALARGTPALLLQDNLKTIVEVLAQEDVAHVLNENHHKALLQVVEVLLEKCDLACCGFELFSVLLAIVSITTDVDNVNKSQELLEDLARKCGQKDTHDLFNAHLTPTLKCIQPSASTWTEHTIHFQIFLGILQLAGPSLGSHLDEVMAILCECVPRKHDPFVSLKCVMRLQTLLSQDSAPLDTQGKLGEFLPVILSDIVMPFLPWHAGKTAAALRTAAVACLTAISNIQLTNQQTITEMGKCLAIIPALIQDDAEDTRLLSCEVVRRVGSTYPDLIDQENLHILADKLVKRFDDVSPAVRLKSASVLTGLFEHLPKDYVPSVQSARLKDLYESASVFLDDPDEDLRSAVAGALEQMGKVSPEILQEVLERDFHKFRNKDYCQQVINSIKALHV